MTAKILFLIFVTSFVTGCGSTFSLTYGDGKQYLSVGATLPEKKGFKK